MANANDVLEYWFGSSTSDPVEAGRRSKLWYQSTAASDNQLREQFMATLKAAENGELEAWEDTPAGNMALVILLDQFSRNLYRGTGAAFDNDTAALFIATGMIDRGEDKSLSLIERAFLYHPFEHAESPEAQNRSVSLFKQLVLEAPEPWMPQISSFLKYAEEHRDIILKFGRFPHRNELLGRASTAEEEAYFKQGGKSFGQTPKPPN